MIYPTRMDVIVCLMLAPAGMALAGIGNGLPPSPAIAISDAAPLRASGSAIDKRAEARFHKLCAKCHEDNGNGESMRDNMPRMPDFTDGKWHRKRTDRQLLVSILDGKGEQMPPFHKKLTDNQAQELVTHIRTMNADSQSPPQPSAGDPEDFDSQFDQLRKELAELKRQFQQVKPDSDGRK